MISGQFPSNYRVRATLTLQAVTRATRFTPPADAHKPVLWVIALGTPAPEQQALLAHFEAQAGALGYSAGFIEAGTDTQALLGVMKENFKNDRVLVLNTDAPAEMVDEVNDYLADRSQTLKPAGAAHGIAVATKEAQAWRALDDLPPVASAGPEPWTVAQLESALSALNVSGVVGSTPPAGSGVPDDFDLIWRHHQDVARGIERMKAAGLLSHVSDELASKLVAFEITMAHRIAKMQQLADANGGFSG
jgi:hypothetical protein